MKEYICIRKCQHEGAIWPVGKKLILDDNAPKPPHHFMPTDQTVSTRDGEEKTLSEIAAKGNMQHSKVADMIAVKEELDHLKVAYDKRWGLTKLKAELINAKKMKGK